MVASPHATQRPDSYTEEISKIVHMTSRVTSGRGPQRPVYKQGPAKDNRRKCTHCRSKKLDITGTCCACGKVWNSIP